MVGSSIWLPTGPARWSGLEVDRPRLVIFYHVEKTGGSAVMKWLHKMANSAGGARLTSLMDFTHTSCFFAMHEQLFPGYREAWDPRRCTGSVKPAWQRVSVAVEFHAYSRRRYWEELVPHLPALRARYAAANGTLLTVAMFREPVSHVLSVYRMWPPSRRCKCGGATVAKHAVPLPEWLPRAVGLQAGSLTLDSWPHVRKGFHSTRGCDALPDGRRRLQTFDVVGVMDCMVGLLSALCERLEWPCEQDRGRLELAMRQSLRRKPEGVKSGGAMMREALAWRSANLSEATRTNVVAAAACDRGMYDDAIRRLGLTPPTRAGEKLDPALCPRAAYFPRSAPPPPLPAPSWFG
jgi:hypothetical protein